MTETRCEIPNRGTDWKSLRERLVALGDHDVDWRSARTAVYVFNAGGDVLQVAKDAYALYQSENALGPGGVPEPEADGRGRRRDGPLAAPRARRRARQHDLGRHREHPARGEDLPRRGARARRRRDGAEIVAPLSVHPAFDKAAHYLGLRVVRVPVATDYRADVGAMAAAITDRTLMLVGSAPCFPYGVIDPIEELSELALERESVAPRRRLRRRLLRARSRA